MENSFGATQDEELDRMMNNKMLQQLMQQSDAASMEQPSGEEPGYRTLPFERGMGDGEPIAGLPPEASQLPVSPMPDVPSGPSGMWKAPIAAAKLGSQMPSGLAGLIKGRVPMPMPPMPGQAGGALGAVFGGGNGSALSGILARAKGGLPPPPGSSALGKAIGRVPTPPMLPGSKAITTPLSKLPGAGAMRKIPGLGKLFGRR